MKLQILGSTRNARLSRRHLHTALLCILGLIPMLFTLLVYADQATYRIIVSIADGITAKERESTLTEFDVQETTSGEGKDRKSGNPVKIITTTHQDELNILRGIYDDKVIGDRALSSVKITLQQDQNTVETRNITVITKAAYLNALATAGVTDAMVQITAPYPVSGTGALAGIFKAFEVATGKVLRPERKRTAVEEISLTTKLKESGQNTEKAVQLFIALKKEIADKNPQTMVEYQKIVEDTSKQLGMQLDPVLITSITKYAQHFGNLNLDWTDLLPQIKDISKSAGDIFNLEKIENMTGISFDQGLLDKILAFIKNIFSAIFQFISDLFSSAKETRG